jgi:hypothetical protein
MVTSRTKRTPEAVPTRTIRPKPTKRLDYLLDTDSDRIKDNDWDDIIIYSDIWYEEVSSWTVWNKRVPI